MAAIVFGEKYEIMTIGTTVQPNPRRIEAFLGRYQGGADFFRPNAVLSLEKQGKNLALRYWGTEPVPLTPLSKTKFYDQIYGASVTFGEDIGGEVECLICQGSGGSYRLKKRKDTP